MCQNIARFGGAGWIDSRTSFVDVANDPLFVDHESCAIAEAPLFIEDSVVLHHTAFDEVAKYRKGNSNLLCKLVISGNAVNTETEDLRVGCFEFGDISLIRFHLLRSTTGERQHISRQHDVLLAFEVA